MTAAEHEYAVKYLDSLGVEATQKNIGVIFGMAPFKKSEITPSWEFSSDLASKFDVSPGTKSYLLKKGLTVKKKQKADTQSLSKKVLEPLSHKGRREEEKQQAGDTKLEDAMKPFKFELSKARLKLRECSIENTSKMAQKQIEGIDELSVKTIEKKYLYPFSMDCKLLQYE